MSAQTNSHSNSNSSVNERVLDRITLSCFGMSKVFKYFNKNSNNHKNGLSSSKLDKSHKNSFSLLTTGLDIDITGQYCVASSNDDNLRFYSCLEGKLLKTVHCSKYGVSCVKFTHHNKAIIEACNKIENECNIRYHSLHDNSYIGCFAGHSNKITSLDVSRIDDTFMSAGLDRYVRLWDLRLSGYCKKFQSNNNNNMNDPNNNNNNNNSTYNATPCVAQVKVHGRPTVCCDNEGLVFAIGTGNNEIKLYDKRQYQNGPFTTFNLNKHDIGSNGNNSNNNSNNNNNMNGNYQKYQEFEWCGLEFSPNGKYILVSTRTNMIYLIDAFEGDIVTTYQSHTNKKNIDLYATFTSDGKYVTCGSTDGDIYFWETEKGKEVCVWPGHPNAVQYCKWNPQYLMAVTSAQNTAFWIPDWNKVTKKQSESKSDRKKSNLKKNANFGVTK